MSKSNLDVWAIQKYPDELKSALSNVKKDSSKNILYTNCISQLSLGNVNIDSIVFDTFLYAEDSDTLIMLMKYCGVDANDIRKYLDSNNINYNEVCLSNDQNYTDYDSDMPELWFAREEYVLREALEETRNTYYSNSCIFYPNINGELSLNYSDDIKIYEIDGRKISGVITTTDKAILLINQNDDRNLKYDDVLKILQDMNFEFSVNKINVPDFLKRNDKKLIYKK